MSDKVMDVTSGDNLPPSVWSIIEKTAKILDYYYGHDEHPQAESLRVPNRVKIDEGYYASIRPGNEEERCRPGVVIWATSVEGYLPCAAISDQTVIINGPAVSPEDVDLFLTKFRKLLDDSFFKG